MKKFFMLLAALAIVVALPSCGGGNEKKELTITEKVNTTLDGIVEVLKTGFSKPDMTEQESVELTNKALALMKDYEALKKSSIRLEGDGTEEAEAEFYSAQRDWYQKHQEEAALINEIAKLHNINIYLTLY